jgi:hypothetical protein
LKLEKFPELNSHNTLKYLTNKSEGAGILVTLSEAGITYVKEVLVNEILTENSPSLGIQICVQLYSTSYK